VLTAFPPQGDAVTETRWGKTGLKCRRGHEWEDKKSQVRPVCGGRVSRERFLEDHLAIGIPAAQTCSGQIFAKLWKIRFYKRFNLKFSILPTKLAKRALGKSSPNFGKSRFVCVLA